MESEVTFGQLCRLINAISEFRDVVREQRQKPEDKYASGVGHKTVAALTGELGKILIYALTNDWQPNQNDDAHCFQTVSIQILEKFPEMAYRRHKSSGKMLIHHTCLKASGRFALESVRMLIQICPSSVQTADAHGALPLHWALRNKSSSVDVVRLLLQSFPEGPKVKDKKGFLPLHWAVHQDNPNSEIVDLLLETYPEGARAVCSSGNLPLHWAVNQDSPSLNVVRALIRIFPDALKKPCAEGFLPLHRLVDRPAPNLAVVKYLLSKYPEALRFPSLDGQIPLHKAVDHSPCSAAVVAVLLDGFPNGARVADNEGYLPLHLALDCAAPEKEIVERLLFLFADAARRPTLDGLLPLHFVVGANKSPSPKLVRDLMEIYPLSAHHLAVDSVPADSRADPESWTGEWVERKWTPLSRAADRNLENIVSVIKEVLSKRNASPQRSRPTSSHGARTISNSTAVFGASTDKMSPKAGNDGSVPTTPSKTSKKAVFVNSLGVNSGSVSSQDSDGATGVGGGGERNAKLPNTPSPYVRIPAAAKSKIASSEMERNSSRIVDSGGIGRGPAEFLVGTSIGGRSPEGSGNLLMSALESSPLDDPKERDEHDKGHRRRTSKNSSVSPQLQQQKQKQQQQHQKRSKAYTDGQDTALDSCVVPLQLSDEDEAEVKEVRVIHRNRLAPRDAPLSIDEMV